MLRRAFDLGITHFDLANNYGPPYGSAEETFGQILKKDFLPYRDELIISTKAGWDMWPGPYGDLGSRKYLLASLDQSLKRMGFEYVDIFYHHRPDPATPMEESLGALDTAVRSGRASTRAFRRTTQANRGSGQDSARSRNAVPDSSAEVFDVRARSGTGIARRPGERRSGSDRLQPAGARTAIGSLSEGDPQRLARRPRFFSEEDDIDEDKLAKVRALNEIASSEGRSLAEMAVAWGCEIRASPARW